MARLRPYALGAVIAAFGFLSVNGVAVATTGHALILGHSNSASAATGLKRTTAGPALQLTSKGSSPAFSVSNKTKIARLNADSVDGASASTLKNTLYRYTPPSVADSTNATMSFPNLPAGRYLASYSLAETTSASGVTVDCGFFQNSLGYELADRASTFSDLAIVAASGVIDTRSETVTFQCLSNGGSYHWYNDQPNYSSVTFLRLDKVVGNTAAPAKRPSNAATVGTGSR